MSDQTTGILSGRIFSVPSVESNHQEQIKSHLLSWAWWWWSSFSCSVLCVSCLTSQTVAHQAPLSMAFSRQEYPSGLPFPSSGDLPHPGIEPASPALQAESLPLSHLGNPDIDGNSTQGHTHLSWARSWDFKCLQTYNLDKWKSRIHKKKKRVGKLAIGNNCKLRHRSIFLYTNFAYSVLTCSVYTGVEKQVWLINKNNRP